MLRALAIATLMILCLSGPLGAAAKSTTPSQRSNHSDRTHQVNHHPLLIWCISRQMHAKPPLSRFKAERWCIAHHQY